MKQQNFLVLLRLELSSSINEYSLYQLENKHFKIGCCSQTRFFDTVRKFRLKSPLDKIIQSFIAYRNSTQETSRDLSKKYEKYFFPG